MKNLLKPTYWIISAFVLVISWAPAFADINHSAFEKSLEEKQVHAIQLINAVGSLANSKKLNDSQRADAEYAFNGFIARFQGIKEDQEAQADNATRIDSKRLDRLITDIHIFLK